MFTRNWYKILGQVMSNSSADTDYITYSGNTHTQVNTISDDCLKLGNTNTTNYYSATMRVVRTSLGSCGGVLFGTGTTQPTIDDYKLAGDIISTISASVSYTRTVTEDSTTFQCVYTINNSGTEEITIGEIGLIGGCDSSAARRILVERTVLDSPVTIPAGGVGQVTYTINFNYPTE